MEDSKDYSMESERNVEFDDDNDDDDDDDDDNAFFKTCMSSMKIVSRLKIVIKRN